MNRDEIIRIAKAVGLGEVDEDGDIWCSDGFYTEEIDSFAQLVAAAERKACAKVCENIATETYGMTNLREYGECAEAIREKGAP
jgi:hypothetical protein